MTRYGAPLLLALALTLAAGCVEPLPPAKAAAKPPPPSPAAAAPEQPAESAPEAPPQPPDYAEGTLPAGAAVLLRHDVAAARRLTYAGMSQEETFTHVREELVEVSAVVRRVWREDVVRPAGGGLAELSSNSQEELVEARQAGRDALSVMRDRPSRGLRLAASARRLGGRGAEPGASDRPAPGDPEPLPEFPQFPKEPVTAGAASGAAAWKLAGAGTFGNRKCWRVLRTLGPAAGGPADAPVASGEDEFIVDAADGTVLRLRRAWRSAGEVLAHGRSLTLALVEDRRLSAEAAAAAAEGHERLGRLLAAVYGRRAAAAGELARELAEAEKTAGPLRAGLSPAISLAARYAAAEKSLTEPRGAARRIDLIPEDTSVRLWAPEKPAPGRKLVPVVFFHGAAALPQAYFDDWRSQAGDRPLLLIFPQSRDWTWQVSADGAVVGSLLEQLGRVYDLEKDAVAFVGHGAGGEMAWALGYGGSFPGFRVRGIAAAGARVPERIRVLASDGKHEDLAARVRGTDVLLLVADNDQTLSLNDVQNMGRWLKTFNPEGVELIITKGAGQRYSTDWTGALLEWAVSLRKKASPKP